MSRLCLHDHSSLSQRWLGLNTISITLFRISIPFVRPTPGLDTIINFIKWLPSCEKKRNWTECQGKLVAHFHNFIAKVLCFISSHHIILSRVLEPWIFVLFPKECASRSFQPEKCPSRDYLRNCDASIFTKVRYQLQYCLIQKYPSWGSVLGSGSCNWEKWSEERKHFYSIRNLGRDEWSTV